MKLAVIGSREYTNKRRVYDELGKFLKKYGSELELVSGGAQGADKLAEAFARDFGITITIFLPEWALYGHSAGIIRTEEIWKYADQGIVFWDGKSKGTTYSFKIAKERNKSLIVIKDEVT